ncbi:MAG: Spy/CpxP family protein refolding chaperone [Pseudanabaena sp.]
MFKSKIFQYGAIAVAVIATSGAIWASNANLKSQSLAQSQTQSQINSQPSSENKPDLDPDDILAQAPNRPDRNENANMPSGRMLKQLNLSTEQLQKLKTIRERELVRIRELAQQSRQANKELRDLLAGTANSDTIRSKHDQVLSLQQELQKQHFERMLAMREVLTPQQRSQLRDILQKNRQDRMKEGMRDRFKSRIQKRFDDMDERSTL